MSHTASAKHNTLAHSQMMSKMKAKTLIPTVLVLFLICVSTLWMFVSSTRRLEDSPVIKRMCDTGGDRLRSIPVTNPPGGDIKAYIEQRNNLSILLNLKQKINAQNDCEKSKSTSVTGGYCFKTKTKMASNHKTDKPLLTELADFFKGKSVGSFGDGPGIYKKLLLETGKLKLYDAYDGAPFSEDTSEGRVQFLDLTLPQYGLPLYDWVMSLEVAEHIPNKYESVFIDNVARHAKEGVVLSWAVPGQAGYHHVNNRPLDYVINLMDSLGFMHDPHASDRLQNVSTFRYLKRNLNVYRRKNTNQAAMQMLLFNI